MEKHKEFIGENCQNGILNAKTSGTPRPNVPAKRAQNDACISSAEREEQVAKAQPKGNVPAKRNVPALRFPEFTEEWRKCKFGEIATGFDYGMNAAAKPYDGQNKYIRITDIDEASSTYNNEDVVSPDGTLSEDYVVNERDILLARTGASTGKSYLYRKSDGKLYFAGFLIRVNVPEHNPYFVFSQLHTHRYWQWVSIMSARSGQPGINSQEYASFPIFTTTIIEENKISTLLSLLDERISIQNRIIEKLETLIKGIIETVISSQKPNTLIKNCLECNSSTLQESQVAETGTCPVYGATGISGYTETADINGESILIIKDGSGVGTVKFVTGEYSYIGTLNSLSAKDGYCLKYIYIALQRFNFEPYKTGMAIPHIYFKDYGKAKIFCPTIKEQFAIAKRISSIEDKVSVEKRILFYYQAQKSYLLSQMLI